MNFVSPHCHDVRIYTMGIVTRYKSCLSPAPLLIHYCNYLNKNKNKNKPVQNAIGAKSTKTQPQFSTYLFEGIGLKRQSS